MKRLALSFLAAALAGLMLASPAGAAFGLKELDVRFENQDGSVAPQAGAHPFALTTTVGFNTKASDQVPYELPDEQPRNLRVIQMPGLTANPTAAPRCSNADFLAGAEENCPKATKVGVNEVTFSEPDEVRTFSVYNLEPPPGVALKLGFEVVVVPVTIEVRIEESPPHRAVASLSNISNVLPIYRSRLTLWGVPASPAHDTERGGPVGIDPKPFLTAPRACLGPLSTTFAAESWDSPGARFEESVLTHDDSEPANPQGMIGCEELGFEPSIVAAPTSKAGSSPSGLDFSLDVDNGGLVNPDPEARANSDIRKTVVTLPEGFTANPGLAEGLGVCTEGELVRETHSSDAGTGCPNASKIGAVEVETPLLEGKSLKGSLFVAEPYANPFGTLLALYMVIKNEELGIKIAQPLKVETDPVTGRITTTAEELPQLPFSHFRLHFRGGARSPLATPGTCGEHRIEAMLYPWSGGPPVTSNSTFEIATGPNNAPCHSGGPPSFKPELTAGTVNNAAGSFSPFNMRLSRSDAEQELTRFSIKLPPGITAKLAGVPYCPEAAIAAARTRTGPAGGAEELASPSCPAASEIGRTLVGAGVGPSLAYAPGKLYLAGPYNGSPLSMVAVTAAKVGPFDLGTVVVRQALRVDPETAEVFIDAAGSDPIPHIIKGIPVHVRDIRAYADRPNFILNPTNCSPTAVASTVFGSGLDFASTVDDLPATVSTPFQAADCAALPFKPRLQITLKGGTRRGQNPALIAKLKMNGIGEAGVGRAQVTLPSSQFLDQGHIRTVCTRVQFAAGAGNGSECPRGSIYGRARATTPILDEPLRGNVYLRSNGGERELPDLVAALGNSQIDFNLIGWIDSVNGRIRNTFNTAPDAPLSTFVLEMQGGKKGLLDNNTNLCRGKHQARADFKGQNGKRRVFRLSLRAQCKKGRDGKGQRRRQ